MSYIACRGECESLTGQSVGRVENRKVEPEEQEWEKCRVTEQNGTKHSINQSFVVGVKERDRKGVEQTGTGCNRTVQIKVRSGQVRSGRDSTGHSRVKRRSIGRTPLFL